jgi:hypothetical protein
VLQNASRKPVQQFASGGETVVGRSVGGGIAKQLTIHDARTRILCSDLLESRIELFSHFF